MLCCLWLAQYGVECDHGMLVIAAEFPQAPARSAPFKDNRLGVGGWIGTCAFIFLL